MSSSSSSDALQLLKQSQQFALQLEAKVAKAYKVRKLQCWMTSSPLPDGKSTIITIHYCASNSTAPSVELFQTIFPIPETEMNPLDECFKIPIIINNAPVNTKKKESNDHVTSSLEMESKSKTKKKQKQVSTRKKVKKETAIQKKNSPVSAGKKKGE